MDGLLSHSLKVKVFRAKPVTLQEAIEVALKEELIHKRFSCQPHASQSDDPSGVLPVTPTSSRNSSMTRSPSPMPSRFRQARSPTPTSSILRNRTPIDAGAYNKNPVESYRRSYQPSDKNRDNNGFRHRSSPQPWNRDQARPSRRETYGQNEYRDSQLLRAVTTAVILKLAQEDTGHNLQCNAIRGPTTQDILTTNRGIETCLGEDP